MGVFRDSLLGGVGSCFGLDEVRHDYAARSLVANRPAIRVVPIADSPFSHRPLGRVRSRNDSAWQESDAIHRRANHEQRINAEGCKALVGGEAKSDLHNRPESPLGH